MNGRIIKIDKEKCNGCGACAAACHEGAIEMIDGVAVLVREDHCDGLGDCLPACPTGAISFTERTEPSPKASSCLHGGCPGTRAKALKKSEESERPVRHAAASQLMQWPCQIKLVPANAPYFDAADLLIAADCTAYAYASFHADLMRNHITLIACPKLDGVDYTEKLAAILTSNDIRSIRVARMEVPCCAGLEYAVKRALQASGKDLPLEIITVSTDGRIL
ncbi:MAG: ferredoxin [Ruminococcaceae bacterium]|nr:ferredoxin [Oscillospiraceae bacterium]